MANQKSDMEKLFKDIACCENVCDYFNGKPKENPCGEIIRSQFGLYDCTYNYNNFQNDCSNFKNYFQIPEPWSGHIDKAPLLFLGSNPSIDAIEYYPRFGEICCSNSKQGEELPLFDGKPLIDFYNERFEKNTEKKDWSKYWKGAEDIASWLYDKKNSNNNGEVIPGCDYALSEVVHCKSTDEEGIKKALEECSGKYLERLLGISPAKVVVVLGKPAKDALGKYLIKQATVGLIKKVPEDLIQQAFKEFVEKAPAELNKALEDLIKQATVGLIKKVPEELIQQVLAYLIKQAMAELIKALKELIKKVPEDSNKRTSAELIKAFLVELNKKAPAELIKALVELNKKAPAELNKALVELNKKAPAELNKALAELIKKAPAELNKALAELIKKATVGLIKNAPEDLIQQVLAYLIKQASKDSNEQTLAELNKALVGLIKKAPAELNKALAELIKKAPEDLIQQALQEFVKKAPEDSIKKALKGLIKKNSIKKALEGLIKKTLEDLDNNNVKEESNKQCLLIKIACNNKDGDITIYKQINNDNSYRYFIFAPHTNAHGNMGLSVDHFKDAQEQIKKLGIQDCFKEMEDCLKCLLYLKNRIAIWASKQVSREANNQDNTLTGF